MSDASAASSRDAPFFEAVIVPHRSLSRKALNRLLAAIGVICAINASIFVALGAWPVAGFTGLELILAGVLFHLNANAARGSEVLLLSGGGMRIIRTEPNGPRRETRLAAGWLRVELRERPGRVPALLLVSHGVAEEVGRVLGEDAKRDLARALDDALLRWRSPGFDDPRWDGSHGR